VVRARRTFSKSRPPLLPGEDILIWQEHAAFSCQPQGPSRSPLVRGALFLTNYRIMFRGYTGNGVDGLGSGVHSRSVSELEPGSSSSSSSSSSSGGGGAAAAAAAATTAAAGEESEHEEEELRVMHGWSATHAAYPHAAAADLPRTFTRADIPLFSVEEISLASGDESTLLLGCKDCRRVLFSFDQPKHWVAELAKQMRIVAFPGVQNSFAFAYGEALASSAAGAARGGWLAYSCAEEMARQGVRLAAGAPWRLHGDTFHLAPTYPRAFAVPAEERFTVTELGAVSRYRSNGRVPSLTYRHGNGAVLVRCSQPGVGFAGKTCREVSCLLARLLACMLACVLADWPAGSLAAPPARCSHPHARPALPTAPVGRTRSCSTSTACRGAARRRGATCRSSSSTRAARSPRRRTR
jgi:hypothetical protein